jgi:hypothetical protein
MRAQLAIAAAMAAALVGCAQFGTMQPKDEATKVAQAIYNNDLSSATANFDDTLKDQATRAQVATISDKMHALGDFQGLTEVKHDDDARRYWYDAKFSNGDMTVEMRLHADGKIAAYRIVPQAAPQATAAAH